MTGGLRPVSEEDARRTEAIGSWLVRLRDGASRRTMASTLRAVERAYLGLERDAPVASELFEWEALDDPDFFEAVQSRLVDRYGREQARKHVAALRSLLRHLASRDVANYELAMRVLEEFRVPRVPSDLPPLHFGEGELFRVLQLCRWDPSPVTGLRDLAMISLAATTGARRHELVSITRDELDLEGGEVLLHVKGGGTRRAVLHPATADHLSHWVERRGDEDGPLFPSLRRGGHLTGSPVSDHQFWKLLRRRSEEAGVDPPIAPHDLRRWFVTTLLEAGVDVFQVARLVGHARVQTTLRYDRRPVERPRETVERLTMPLFEELTRPEEEP